MRHTCSSVFCVTSQQLPQLMSVIVPIWQSLYRMNVIFGGLFVGKKYPRVVIKLKQSHRALDAIVKRVFRTEPPNPGEISFGQLLLDLLQSELQWF